MLRHLRRAALIALALLIVGAFSPASAGPVTTATQPQQPPPGALGGQGPCGQSVQRLDNTTPRVNPLDPPLSISIFTPTGGASTPLVGGQCSSAKRPTIFLSHGFWLSDPASYGRLITHWVSVGNAVVFSAYDSVSHPSTRAELEKTYYEVDTGNAQAVGAEPRIDTSRVGFWGHSHGGGMVPYLVQQGVARGWGTKALWLTLAAPAYSQLVGAGAITVPAHARAMVTAMEDDEFADARMGIDVFHSLTLDPSRKDHITVNTDVHGLPAFVANHGAPVAQDDSDTDGVDFALWRYTDILESCSVRGRSCQESLTYTGTWGDGVPVVPATVTDDPIDVGPAPALLAECDLVWGPTLNPRIANCGTTHI